MLNNIQHQWLFDNYTNTIQVSIFFFTLWNSVVLWIFFYFHPFLPTFLTQFVNYYQSFHNRNRSPFHEWIISKTQTANGLCSTALSSLSTNRICSYVEHSTRWHRSAIEWDAYVSNIQLMLCADVYTWYTYVLNTQCSLMHFCRWVKRR